MTAATARKTRTNITLDAALLAEARALGINVSAVTEAALRHRVRAARAAAWTAENAAALAERRAWIDAHGPALGPFQVLDPGP